MGRKRPLDQELSNYMNSPAYQEQLKKLDTAIRKFTAAVFANGADAVMKIAYDRIKCLSTKTQATKTTK